MAAKLSKYASKVPRPVKRPSLLEELLADLSTSVQKATEGGMDGIIRKLDDWLEETIAATDAVRQTAKRVFGKLAPKLNDTERALLRNLTNGDWAEMVQTAHSFVRPYKNPRTPGSREAAVRSLKGFIAEIVFFRSGIYSKALEEAKKRAADLGLKGPVRLIRDIRARTIDAAGQVSHEALTDGILAVQRKDRRWQILTVFEMKSLSNFRDLARGRGGKIKKSMDSDALLDEEVLLERIMEREGQLSRDFERLAEATVEFDGKQFAGGELVISKHITRFLGVLPSGKRLSDRDVRRIRQEIPSFEQTRQVARNEILNDLARELLDILSGR